MKKTVLSRLILSAFAVGVTFNSVWAQSEQEQPTKKVNFGYSQNPKTKSRNQNSQAQNLPENRTNEIPTLPQTGEVAEKTTEQTAGYEGRSIASKTLEIAKRAGNAAISPTEIYKIGVGDILFISLQNAPAKDSTYFTVLNDGTIDYPLAGEMLSVNGLTSEEVEDLLKLKVKLYENPQISVKVREHASHRITVLGLVDKAGEKYLQREAMPLFIVRAEAIVQAKASLAVIKRADSKTETIDLKDSKSDEVLIFPGDIIEFKSDESLADDDSSAPQFYYIGGNIISAGQKNFHSGLTLTQAIFSSGGLKKQTVRKVIIRRKNQTGLLSPIEFDLNAIKNGKQPDPILRPGDTIEVIN
jgi:protein involved in polysaccharide export with SLBB domain